MALVSWAYKREIDDQNKSSIASYGSEFEIDKEKFVVIKKDFDNFDRKL